MNRTFRLTFATLATLLLLAPTLQAEEEPSLATVEGQEDLEKVRRAAFRETYVNTAADWTKYDKLYLGEAHYDYRDVGPAERYRTSRSMRSTNSLFGISEEDRRKFEEITGEAFDKQIIKGKNFTITEEIDDTTLYLRGGVVDIISRVPPEYVGRAEVYLASVGEATLIMEFLDGTTGEVLARVAERGVIGSNRGGLDSFSMPSNRVTVTADVRRWASNAASRLRRELDDAIAGK